MTPEQTQTEKPGLSIKYAQSELKDERGWTDALVRKFLGQPDELKANPYYKKAPKMKLYLLARIEKAEQTQEFKLAVEKAKVRKKGAQKGLVTKTNNLVEKAKAEKIDVPLIEREKLMEAAIENYKSRLSLYRDEEEAQFLFDASDEEFISRICANYLRHCCSRYEEAIYKYQGKVGFEEALKIIREKVLNAISSTYPFLSEECANRRNRYEMRI
jgi:hypothetical protein